MPTQFALDYSKVQQHDSLKFHQQFSHTYGVDTLKSIFVIHCQIFLRNLLNRSFQYTGILLEIQGQLLILFIVRAEHCKPMVVGKSSLKQTGCIINAMTKRCYLQSDPIPLDDRCFPYSPRKYIWELIGIVLDASNKYYNKFFGK